MNSGLNGSVLSGHVHYWIYSPAFPSDSELMASVSDAKAVRFWDTRSGTAVTTLLDYEVFGKLLFRPMGCSPPLPMATLSNWDYNSRTGRLRAIDALFELWP